MKTKKTFSQDDIRKMEPLEKLGLYATVNPDGLPHVTFINSLMARDARSMTFGQFVRGESKWYMQKNPKIAFFIFSPHAKRMWVGKATWSHKKEDGPELERYKEMPMQRYNSYFPINVVHYLDLVETTAALRPPAPGMVVSSILTKLAKKGAATRIHDRILKPYAEKLFNKLTTLKFLSFIDADGFPKIAPFVQCMAPDSRRLAFSPALLDKEVKRLPAGADVAVFCLSTTLESVLTRGRFLGFRKYKGIKLGVIDIDWVYNSMPPNAGQIYPEIKLEPVVEF
ncbi:MAG: hypothetical protein GY859_16170 [Desulfobacterales bacterium]|nr:hypothetical protein [Desulfobacterales bacterium]